MAPMVARAASRRSAVRAGMKKVRNIPRCIYTDKDELRQARCGGITLLPVTGSIDQPRETIIMKAITSVFALGILGLFLSAPAAAHSHHTAQAMEHAGMAQAHGEDGHAKVLLKHAEESLKHAEAAEKEHAEQHKHMSESVKHLKEAIQHAKAGHAPMATTHVEEALTHMRKSMDD